ncbi:hypothetical protein L682_28065 [Aquipseudomonas alcaligenes OT 69]|nr:hypothetical protein L682_28065 [Pseudomonas alcaligenes OT 69]
MGFAVLYPSYDSAAEAGLGLAPLGLAALGANLRRVTPGRLAPSTSLARRMV